MPNYCGTIAILGLPNAGKSTLLNALIGQKIAGVSRKPQTTRNRIAGILTEGEHQYVFFDTPGFCKPLSGRGPLYRAMHEQAMNTLGETDIVCYLIDAQKGIQEQDEILLGEISKRIGTRPFVLLMTKMDTLDKAAKNDVTQSPSRSESLKSIPDHKILFISAKNKNDLTEIKSTLASHLPENEWQYDSEDLTDRPMKFVAEELIREKIFRQLGQELPFKIAVFIESWEEQKSTTKIFASIITEKDSHKPMIIGKGASKLRQIGMESRLDLERLLGHSVYLDLHVRIEPNWTLKPHLLSEFQHLSFTTKA